MSLQLLCSIKFRLQTLRSIGTRRLSINETANALRPFIFTVHPDLFGRYPKERAINEESLKRLNEHIHQLQSQHRVQPLTLTFYVRSHNHALNEPEIAPLKQAPYSPTESGVPTIKFRPVRIQLQAQNIRETVKTVLSSCNLPLDYVDNVSPSPRAAGKNGSATSAHGQSAASDDHFADTINATIRDRFYGVHAYDQAKIRMRRMARDTLSQWLQKNVDRGRHNALQMAPTRQEIARLKDTILAETSIADIQWQCNWTLSSYRTALRCLLRVCRQYAGDLDLKGRTIVFGTETGVCIQGHIILRHDDVADHWIQTLTSLQRDSYVHGEIPAAEQRLSALLGGVEVARQPHLPVMMATDYLRQLHKLALIVREERDQPRGGSKVAGDMTGVQIAVECNTGSLMVTQYGQILVPSSCPAFLIVDFINSHAAEARQIRQEFLRTEKSHMHVVERCFAALGLESLTRDANVTRAQMESFCRRLLQLHEMSVLPVDMTSCRLQVAQFYSVMSDGDICVPWNFEDVV